MGFSYYLIDRYRSILPDHVNALIRHLPPRLLGEWVTNEDHVWSLATNIELDSNPDGIGYLKITGIDSIHGKYAMDMVIASQQVLQYMGFRIEVFSFELYLRPELYRWLGNDVAELKHEEIFL